MAQPLAAVVFLSCRTHESPWLFCAHGGSLSDHPYGDDEGVVAEGEPEDAAEIAQMRWAECQHLKDGVVCVGGWFGVGGGGRKTHAIVIRQ